MLPRGLEYKRGVNQSTADSGQAPLTPRPLQKPADADTDAGCSVMRGVSSLSVCDTVKGRCLPPDSDTDWWLMMSGRPDSDAQPLLTDSSLSQSNEPDRLV